MTAEETEGAPPIDDLEAWLAKVRVAQQQEREANGPSLYVDNLLGGITLSGARILREYVLTRTQQEVAAHSQIIQELAYLRSKIEDAVS